MRRGAECLHLARVWHCRLDARLDPAPLTAAEAWRWERALSDRNALPEVPDAIPVHI